MNDWCTSNLLVVKRRSAVSSVVCEEIHYIHIHCSLCVLYDWWSVLWPTMGYTEEIPYYRHTDDPLHWSSIIRKCKVRPRAKEIIAFNLARVDFIFVGKYMSQGPCHGCVSRSTVAAKKFVARHHRSLKSPGMWWNIPLYFSSARHETTVQ